MKEKMKGINDLATTFFWVGGMELGLVFVLWEVLAIHVYVVFAAGLGVASIFAGAAFFLLSKRG